MKKQVIYGYVARTKERPLSFKDGTDCEIQGQVYHSKGVRWMWNDSDWPPIKVRITIEEVKP